MACLRWKKTWILAVSWNRCSLLHQSCLRRNASPMQARLRKCNQRAVLYRTYKSKQKDLALEERMEKVGFKTERYLAKECASCCDSSSRLLWARGNTLSGWQDSGLGIWRVALHVRQRSKGQAPQNQTAHFSKNVIMQDMKPALEHWIAKGLGGPLGSTVFDCAHMD
jgi:hypothetical protein